MSSLVIVAIPAEDDYVHKISSEKVAHLTLLFLGEDVSKVKNVTKILDFVGHASTQSLTEFGLEVDHRGELGEDSADVLFFSKTKWSGYPDVNSFRSILLKDDNIRRAYDSAEQFPEWTPHLTLGFPETPAKEDTRDYPGIKYVQFDRIAVWFGESEGVEYRLKSHDWDTSMEPSATMMGNASKRLNDVLEHHGIKGMKWGRRSAGIGAQAVVVADKRKKLKTSGGGGRPAHSDAIRARTSGQIAKKSGIKSLSNKELQDYNQRLNLEQQAKRLAFQDKSKGKQFVSKLIGRSTSQGVESAGKAALSSQVVRRKVAVGAAALALA